MPTAPISKLSILRGAESFCLTHGVDGLSLAALARSIEADLKAVAAFFHDEMALLDAVLERHQSAYEAAWEEVFDTIQTPRDALHLLTSTIASLIEKEDGGPAYVAIAAQMSTSTRFALTARPATTSPAALRLIGTLMGGTKLSFEMVPIRFERFAVVLFSSVFSWYRQGAGRLSKDAFVHDLTDTLEYIAIGEVSRAPAMKSPA
jgi:hypothetical protein